MNGVGLFFLLLLLLVILPVGGWVAFTRWRAHQAGLPPPPLSAYNPFKRSLANTSFSAGATRSRGGVVNWVQDKFRSLRNPRASGGAYESERAPRTGFGPLDPDGAWDTRLGAEADAYGRVGDYEEQELGLHPPAPGAYGGSGYGAPSTTLPQYRSEDIGRGRSKSREPEAYIGGSQRGLDQRYDEEMGRVNPFGDTAERSSLKNSLRDVSPRPVEVDGTSGPKRHAKKDSDGTTGESPTERKSMFRENM